MLLFSFGTQCVLTDLIPSSEITTISPGRISLIKSAPTVSSAQDSLFYNVAFGVEGAIPAVLADAALGAVCLVLAAKQGRLGELKQKRVTPGKDPEGPQPLSEYKSTVDNSVSEWHYTDTK